MIGGFVAWADCALVFALMLALVLLARFQLVKTVWRGSKVHFPWANDPDPNGRYLPLKKRSNRQILDLTADSGPVGGRFWGSKVDLRADLSRGSGPVDGGPGGEEEERRLFGAISSVRSLSSV